jgi:hypothetical protein
VSEREAQREELRAALEARRELGEELEPHVIDSFLERIERRVEQRLEDRREAPARRGQSFVITLTSLGVAIPLMGIAGGTAGFFGVVAVCVALVLVVYFARAS